MLTADIGFVSMYFFLLLAKINKEIAACLNKSYYL